LNFDLKCFGSLRRVSIDSASCFRKAAIASWHDDDDDDDDAQLHRSGGLSQFSVLIREISGYANNVFDTEKNKGSNLKLMR
jgi:hypothetical protein